MALVVQKYGGTSVANIAKIENVARKVIRAKEEGNQVVVVLSAMAGETDRLINLAHQVADEVEAAIMAAFPNADVLIHEDPASEPPPRPLPA